MSLAIKFGNFLDDKPTTSGFVYIDAVLNYSRDFKGQLTSHPIGSGSNISDHFIRSNPTYSFSGVISGADISRGTYLIKDLEGVTSPSNTHLDIPQVQIQSSNKLLSLIPQTISSFFVDAESSVRVDTSVKRQTLEEIRIILERLFDSSNSSPFIVKLFEYEGSKVTKLIDNLVCTSLSFREDAESGYALYVDMTLEQATFTALKTTKLSKKDIQALNSKKVDKSIAAPAASKTNAGVAPESFRASPEAAAAIAAQKASDASALSKMTDSANFFKDLKGELVP